MQPEEKARAAKMVRTVVPETETRRVSLTAHGELIPARRLVMEPEVRGRIVRQHELLIPGGRIEKGTELFAVDDTLGKLDVRGAAAAIKRADADLFEAKRKYDEAKRLADENITSKTELAAREAEVAIEQAELEQFQAVHDRAKEMLRRYSVKSPFNALVVEEAVAVRVQAGEDAGARRTAQRGRVERTLESHALARQAVQGRSLDDGMPRAAHRFGVVVVAYDEDDVGTATRGGAVSRVL